ALTSAKQFGYPVLVRSRFVSNLEELIPLVNSALAQSSQLLICKSLKGWKKVEYEVVRDQYDNCIMVCNRENIDPTAPLSDQSIVVVPSQTLSSDEFNLLRSISIKVVRHLGIVGQCNVQFALNPLSVEYYIIKVNIRLTRSSALASRVTGYPLGYITTKLALGMSLIDLKNHITYETYSCFEPTLDCIAIKIPPWDLKQFVQCSHQIGMKSIEVVAISRSFEEAFQKCLRMVDENFSGFESYERTITDDEISSVADVNLFILATAFHRGYTIERLYQLTQIDRWFLYKFQAIIQFRVHRFNSSIIQDRSLLLEAKRLGFSDKQISKYCGTTELKVCESRKQFGMRPSVKMIDTVFGQWSAQTDYLYITYHGNDDDIQSSSQQWTEYPLFKDD
ncbi:unnamed protein product, partial [Rotaria sp. Silwood1]